MKLRKLLEITTSSSVGDNLIPYRLLRKAIRRPQTEEELYALINFDKRKK